MFIYKKRKFKTKNKIMFGRDKWKPTSKCCLYFNKGIQGPSGIRMVCKQFNMQSLYTK